MRTIDLVPKQRRQNKNVITFLYQTPYNAMIKVGIKTSYQFNIEKNNRQPY